METTTLGGAGGASKYNFLLRMKLWQKFALLGVLALALSAYPLYALVKSAQEAITVVRGEQAGLPPINAVLGLAKTLQDHRGSSSYLVLGDAKRGEPQPKHAAAVDEALAKLEKLAGSIEDPVLNKRLADIKRDWLVLKSGVNERKIDQRQVTQSHIALIRITLRAIEDVTYWSAIDLESDVVTYYTARAALIDLPQLSEAIGQLRSPIVSRLENIAQVKANAELQGKNFDLPTALRDAYRPSDRANITDTLQDLELAARHYDDNMRKAIAKSPEIGRDTQEQVKEIRSAIEAAVQLVRREILAKEIPEINAKAYLEQVTAPREAVQKAATQGELIVAALDKRATVTRNNLVQVLVSEAVVLLLGIGLAVVTVRNITGTVSSLQGSVDKVRQGDFAALGVIDSRDEVGDLGRTVNLLLQERISAQQIAEKEKQNAEAENESLNNSVIAILQAVHQLSEKDLTAKAPVSQDIIGTVSDSINLLTDETAKVLSDVTRIAYLVEQASGKVKGQATLVSQTAEAERKSVGMMIESLSDATQSMVQVAALAVQSNESAGRATTATSTALETVDGTVKGMNLIRETIAETEKRIKRLGERSQEISGIVNLINTISERTHVLALNASMQAAVAGEAGRGFAVVAEEVQRLAESSRNATQQIAALVNNIQLETNETIATVNRTIGQVVSGSEQAQKAGDQMRLTQGITAQLVNQVRSIAEASEKQREMSVHLLQSVQGIGESTELTARQIDSQNTETDGLLLSARQLVASVGVFKLPQSA